MSAPIECTRTICAHRSSDPKRDGWTWIEFPEGPLRTGWWCPQCHDGLKRTLEALGIAPDVEPLH